MKLLATKSQFTMLNQSKPNTHSEYSLTLDIVGTDVLVVQIVGVLPHITAEERLLSIYSLTKPLRILPRRGLAALPVERISRLPSSFFTSQDQPEPK